MILTDRHISFENECRCMFVEQIIRAVIYGELKYFCDEEGNNINPEPYYTTKYPEVDSLDHSIYFKTDYKTIYVFWDNTFTSYGLTSKLVELTEATNDYEQKWDVSTQEKWTEVIGHKIVGFEIFWEETCVSNLDSSNKVYTMYPQSFKINTENGKTIILSASEFKRDREDEVYPLMDNLLVTTNTSLARKLKIIQ